MKNLLLGIYIFFHSIYFVQTDAIVNLGAVIKAFLQNFVIFQPNKKINFQNTTDLHASRNYTYVQKSQFECGSGFPIAIISMNFAHLI